MSTWVTASSLPTLTIECPPDITIGTDPDGCVATNPNISGPTTGGDPGEVITNDAPTEFPLGVTTVTWTVSDGTDSESCQQVITVEDMIAPRIPERLAWDDLNNVDPITDADENNSYGLVMNVDGDNLVVGAGQGTAAYILERMNGTWSEEHELIGTNMTNSGGYGRAVDIDGDFAVVGAYFYNTDAYGEGKVFIFEKNTSGNWVESDQLLASDKADRDYFGKAVAIQGDYLLVGAYGQDDLGSSSGCVYVFEKDSNDDWVEQGKFYGSGTTAGDLFGYDVIFRGDTVLVSAYKDDIIVQNEGAVYIFEHDGSGTFTEVQKVTYSLAEPDSEYGNTSIAMDGNYLAMGSDTYDVNVGAVAMFEKDANGVFQEVQLITPPDGNWKDFFGTGIVIQDNILAVGSNDESAHYNSGAIYTYERQSDGTWTFTDKIRPTSVDHHFFGQNIQFHDDGQLIAGAPSFGSSDNFEDAVYYINSSIAGTLIDANVGCGETVIAPVLEDNCAGSITGTTSDALPTNGISEYDVTWDFDDGNGNLSSYQQLINVFDGEGPTLTCADVTVTVDPDNNFQLTDADLGITYSDACGDVTVLTQPNIWITCGDVGTENYIIQVEDDAGNRSDCTGTVTVLNASDTVLNLDNAGANSLRDLVNDGCAGDTLYFDETLAGGTIVLESEIDITKSKVIVGLGENDLTIDGDNRHRIFHVTATNLDVHISGMTLTKSNVPTQGGAFLNEGNLYLSDMIFINNYENASPKPWTNEKDLEISAGTVDVRD